MKGLFRLWKRWKRCPTESNFLRGTTIHPVFHVSCLKPYHADQMDSSRNVPTRPLPTVSSLEKQVDLILADRVVKLPNGAKETQFLVRWKGCPESHTSWEP